jgi:hypothetical protein
VSIGLKQQGKCRESGDDRMMMRSMALVAILAMVLCSTVHAAESSLPYTVVDTGQVGCYSNRGPIRCPEKGQPFYGQDAQYETNSPRYRDHGDGTITDLNTGLMWQKTPDFKFRSWVDAQEYAKSFKLAGHGDWRVPTIKELFSIADFRGNLHTRTPYVDTKFFAFTYPPASRRIIDAQYWSSNQYVGITMRGDQSAFGFNFADGRIKAYPIAFGESPRGSSRMPELGRYVRCVRGRAYGENDFQDNGDGTITDRATGLMWVQQDSGKTMNWKDALAYAENLEFAGYDDWRLPNVKELQSIVDYSRAPDARSASARGPALDPLFKLSEKESWFWTSTTHIENQGGYYVCFGQGLSALMWQGHQMNAHGAGAVRSDPKSGNPSRWSQGLGPQGDEIRINNYVRCVRGGGARFKKVTAVPSAGGGGHFVKRLDRNGDGKVSPKEFDGPRSAFPTLDRNHDGFLTEDEAPRPPSHGGGGRRGFVRRLDRNGDGKVSPKEFDGPSNHFRMFDRNRDGYISSNEAPTGPPPRRRHGPPR